MRENYYEKAKEVFKKPQKRFYFGRQLYGNPYFFPWNYNEKIISITKSEDKRVHRSDYKFKLWGYDISFGTPIIYDKPNLTWDHRDDDTIRIYHSPTTQILFFGLQLCIFHGNEKYWEMLMWYLKICDKDIVKSELEWPWRDSKTKISTWEKKYLKNG